METFVSGYCRVLDNSRMVAVETEGKTLVEVDCQYLSCPYAPNCPIGQKIRELSE